MATKEIVRKIAVIFATDVVGYSKSVEKNEDQTIKNFRACKKILEDLFKEHDGRIFNTAGDSVLAEFSSAVSAVISGNFMIELPALVVVTYPVRVVQHIRTSQRLHQRSTIPEVERMDLHPSVEGVVTADCVGQRADPLALIE